MKNTLGLQFPGDLLQTAKGVFGWILGLAVVYLLLVMWWWRS